MLMEALGAKGVFDLQSLEQQLDYSVVLMRRGRADEAIVFLTPLTRKHPDNLILHSHFATAHLLSPNASDRNQAAGLMRDCLEIWPKTWDELSKDQQGYLGRMGWGQGLYEQNRKYEIYLQKLMQFRRKQPKGGIFLDELFGTKEAPIRYISAEGKYEAGRIVSAEKAKLPGDAIEIVEQLLVWMPNDLPLYWQLGEIFNASAMDKKNDPQGSYQDIKAAHEIMKKMVGPLTGIKQTDLPRELVDHTKVLEDYLKNTKEPAPKHKDLELLLEQQKKVENPDTPEISYRQLVVAFVVGLLVGMFAIWQIQEMRRRRQARANAYQGR
ncbi:MAG TPA: hypothetical protein VFE62_26805 [Gemmataceae bacterium]|nr:hypothetical protein [Gemmataceae bacterium]